MLPNWQQRWTPLRSIFMKLLQLTRDVISFETPVGAEETPLKEFMQNPADLSPIDTIVREHRTGEVDTLLDCSHRVKT